MHQDYTLSNSGVRNFFQEGIFRFLFYIRKLNNKMLKIRFELYRFTYGKFLLVEHGVDQERWNKIFVLIVRLTFVWAIYFILLFFFVFFRNKTELCKIKKCQLNQLEVQK